MALYREESTGFVQEWSSNPGAGYTALSAQPQTTITDRVNWWRGVDLCAEYGPLTQTSAWHPSIQGGSEIPAPPGVNGSGINIMAWRYSSFEELGDLGYDGIPPMTYEGAGAVTTSRPAGLAGYHGNYRLRLTWDATGGRIIWFGQLATLNNIDLYNIKLTTNRRWIISLYVAPTTSGAKAFTVLLKTKSIAGAEATYSQALTTGATAGTWERVYFGLDLSQDSGNKAVLGFQAGASIEFDLDSIMIEEWIGNDATPSAYVATSSYVTGEQLVDVAVDKLTAGTITGQTIVLSGGTAVIKSSNYSAGSAGWAILGDGSAEFSSASIRGTLSASVISGGTLNCSLMTVSNLSASSITTGTLNCSTITVTNFNAGSITAGTLDVARIGAATITGAKIASATITGSNIASATITGSNIGSATITGSNIAGGTITGANIASATISGSQISGGTITGTNISASTITGSKISSSTIDTGNVISGAVTNFVTQNYSSTLIAGETTVATLSFPGVSTGYRGPITIVAIYQILNADAASYLEYVSSAYSIYNTSNHYQKTAQLNLYKGATPLRSAQVTLSFNQTYGTVALSYTDTAPGDAAVTYYVKAIGYNNGSSYVTNGVYFEGNTSAMEGRR